MGRYDLRAQRVLATANLALETKRISSPPVWHQILQDIPPPPRLTRPVRSHRQKSKFKPERISYPEDTLRQEFFSDHPWELARPRVVLEDGGDDHAGYDWSGLEQEGKRVDGESVIQHQQHLLTHGYQPTPTSPPRSLTKSQAYDLARRQLYTHRHFEDIERRIAREEALHTGAYFQPGPNALAAPLEDAKFDAWREWAARRVASLSNMRMAGYSGSEVEDGPEGGESSVVEESEGEIEEGQQEVEAPKSGRDAIAEAVARR